MKRVADCYDCVLNDLKGALKLLPLPEFVVDSVSKNAETYLAGQWDRNLIPSTYITGVHRILKQHTGLDVPFEALRKRCNEAGLRMAAEIDAEVGRVADEKQAFAALVRWAIAGNHLDFRTVGTGYGFETSAIRKMLEEKIRQGLSIDHTDAIYDILKNTRNLLYIPDNVGELAFDKLLIRRVRSWGARVTVPYRGGAITSDAILDDFESVGIADVADRVICAGPDTLGVSWEEKSDDLARALGECDTVLTKGQANYYCMHEWQKQIPGKIICLLTTKCAPVSAQFGFTEKISVAAVLKP